MEDSKLDGIACHLFSGTGLANVSALSLAVATFQACHFIGLPECEVSKYQVQFWLLMVGFRMFFFKKKYELCHIWW